MLWARRCAWTDSKRDTRPATQGAYGRHPVVGDVAVGRADDHNEGQTDMASGLGLLAFPVVERPGDRLDSIEGATGVVQAQHRLIDIQDDVAARRVCQEVWVPSTNLRLVLESDTTVDQVVGERCLTLRRVRIWTVHDVQNATRLGCRRPSCTPPPVPR